MSHRARFASPIAGPFSAFEFVKSMSMSDRVAVLRMVGDAYACPCAREGVALVRRLVKLPTRALVFVKELPLSPETSARDVAPLFYRDGNAEFPAAVFGNLKDVLVGERGKSAQCCRYSGRTAAQYGLKMSA